MINGNNLSLVINEEEYIRIVKEFKSQKSTSITGKIKSLFIFIGFLHSNIANFKTYESILKKTEELRKTYNSLGPINNYKDRIYENKLMEKLRSKDRIIMDNISIPIRDIAAYLDIYDLSLKSNVWNWCISEIKELHENVIEEDVPIIQKYGQMYTEYRETVNNDYGWTHFFKDLDKTLDYLFSFYNDNNTTVIVAEKPSDSNTKETLQLKPLFNFIDFLHANIDNFNQYDITIRELKKKIERHSQLGFHYTEKNERDALQEVINEEWDVIIENIVNPIKEKVAELAVFDWQAPETLSNNYFHIANRLCKRFDKKDLSAILKAKNQYIEFTNKISPRVIQQAERVFEYLYEIMVEIAKNFHKEGDMRIKHQKKKRVGTFQELIEGFQAWEKVSLPISLNNSVTANSQTVPKALITNTALNIEKNVAPNNDTTMDINFEAIFELALTYTDDPAEMKEFCIREQKKADRDYFYKKSTFYKGLLKVVAKEKERAKPTTNPQPATMRIGSMFVAGTGGSPYKYGSITLLEQIVNELLCEDKALKEELASHEKSEGETILQSSHIPEPAKKFKTTENKPKYRKNEKKFKERVIDSELLGQYFKSSFHGMGDSQINYFSMLVNELKTKRTGKQFGEIALLIYNSEHVNNRMPRGFNKWFIIFCECIDIKKPTYKRGVLENPAYNLKQLFNYL